MCVLLGAVRLDSTTGRAHRKGSLDGTPLYTGAGVCSKPEHVNFMARKAKGLVCLAMTEDRCRTSVRLVDTSIWCVI